MVLFRIVCSSSRPQARRRLQIAGLAKEPLIRQTCRPDARCSVICGRRVTPTLEHPSTCRLSKGKKGQSRAQNHGWTRIARCVVGRKVLQNGGEEYRKHQSVRARLTICYRQPSILLLDLEIIAQVFWSSIHFVSGLIVWLLGWIIVFWSLSGWTFVLVPLWGLRHL